MLIHLDKAPFIGLAAQLVKSKPFRAGRSPGGNQYLVGSEGVLAINDQPASPSAPFDGLDSDAELKLHSLLFEQPQGLF